MGSQQLTKLNETTFDKATATGVVLVDFYADWCGPCRMLTPILEELAQEMNGKVTIVKVDTEESGAIAERFEVTSIPTLVLLKNGALVKRVVGLRNRDELRTLVNSAL